MAFITTSDGTRIFCNDWGPKDAHLRAVPRQVSLRAPARQREIFGTDTVMSISFAEGVAGARLVGRAVVPGRAAAELLARCMAWLRGVNEAGRLRGMEPRMARDIGAPLGSDRRPEGFAMDPRPLWGIGLTPMPMNTLPSRQAGRGA